MNYRYELYHNYKDYNNNNMCWATDDEEEAFDFAKENRKSVVFDNVTNCFLE